MKQASIPQMHPRSSAGIADLVIHNARACTMDPARPYAEALAAFGDRIVAVGDNAEVDRWIGQGTRVFDAAGASVLPGFNDAHVHFLTGGFSLSEVNLRAATSLEQCVRLLGDFARRKPCGTWITGGEWDHENWPGAPLPTRHALDPFTPEHPVLIHRLDGHMAAANSLALRLAGIAHSTNDPPGGCIVRDTVTGEPTGVMKDSAIDLVRRCIPPPSRHEKLEAARAATRHAASLGVTSVTDVSADADISVYQALQRDGGLLTRIYAARTIVAWQALAEVGVQAGFGGPMLRIGVLKGFSDGSLGSLTARFFEPYLGTTDRGLFFDQMCPEGAMLKRVLAADAAGLQVMIHAIGDEANATILDLYAEVERRSGPRDRRFRIEHAQHLRAEEIGRFGTGKIIASVQPYHLADDGRWCEKRIGPKRARTTYAFRSLLECGAMLAFGSDWTVAPLDPMPGLEAAVTRRTFDGQHPDGWIPEEKLTLAEALRAYTLGSAYAEFADRYKGSLTRGKLADCVVLDRDIEKVPPSEIGAARVRATVVGGQIVYEE